MSEFPWERAEASKQLEERVTRLEASLPGGLAGDPFPINPGVVSESGLQPQPLYMRQYDLEQGLSQSLTLCLVEADIIFLFSSFSWLPIDLQRTAHRVF